MRFLDSLESRFGRYAIPGILGYILLFQCIVFAVQLVNPQFGSVLELVRWERMNGQWWRLISFMVVPDDRSPLMFIFYVMIMFMFMNRIESGFGAFRMNLFVLLFILTQWLAAWLWSPSEAAFAQGAAPGVVQPMPSIFYNNLLFVFAVLEPGMTILLFGIVPLTARIIAFISAGLLLMQILRSPEIWSSIVLALAPFLCFGIPIFVRHWRHRASVGNRRTRFRANSIAPADSFHRCSVCGRTDASDPDLDFRITGDGAEYCTDHLPKDRGENAA
jgi:hypothetical protein